MSIYRAADEADRHDQATPILVDDDEEYAPQLPAANTSTWADADEADYLDQQRVVPVPDDDYPIA